MRQVGCGMIGGGVFAVVAGVVLFGVITQRALDARAVETLALQIDEPASTEVLRVAPETLCQIGVKLEVHAPPLPAEDRPVPGGNVEIEVPYHYPISYTVADAEGNRVHAERIAADWNGRTRASYSAVMTPAGREAHAEHLFEQFEVPRSGEIRIEIEVGEDDKHESDVRQIDMVVYENVSEQVTLIAGGILALFFGMVLCTLGGMLMLVGNQKQRDSEAVDDPFPPETGPGDTDAEERFDPYGR